LHALDLSIVLTVFLACGYFFQGGGWNQNAHFVTTIALVDEGTVYLDTWRGSSGDIANAGEHIVANKAIGTALAAIPAYLVAKLLTWPLTNVGNALILRAYLTTLGTSGLALAMLAWLFFRYAQRTLEPGAATAVALAMALATPLFPSSTMLSSHPLVSLAAFGAFMLLTRQTPLSNRALLAAGVLAALPVTMEYLTGVILLPLGLLALVRMRGSWRLVFMAMGIALVALVPLTYHLLVFGHPLHTGYDAMVNPEFAHAQAQGWHGFTGLSVWRLYQLTFGPNRGYFFLSPLLLAAVPGWVAAIRRPASRRDALAALGVGGLVLGLVASFVHWHSGSATGSRYALLFVTFAVVGVVELWPRYRGYLQVGALWGGFVMLMSVSVTAIPPPPGQSGPVYNVLAWWWGRFWVGDFSVWQQAVAMQHGRPVGTPTLPYAFNLGQLLGLNGLWSLVPLVLTGGLVVVTLRRALMRWSPTPGAAKTMPTRAAVEP